MDSDQSFLSTIRLPLVLVRGAGDIATGIGIRLHRCGFPVVMTEIEHPLVVRRAVAYAEAIFDGATHVEEDDSGTHEHGKCARRNRTR